MELPAYLSFAVSPLLIIIGLIYLKVSLKVKNWSNIRNAILLGIIGVIFVLAADYVIQMRWQDSMRNMRRVAFYVFVVIGFSAEFAKLLSLRLAFFNRKTFDGPIEGIIYTIFIGLGYSMISVVLFAYGYLGTSLVHRLDVFLYTYPLANIVFAICLGFFIGMGKLRKNILIDNTTGLFIATFFHGLFYFGFITRDIRLLIFTSIGFVIIAITLVSRAVKIRKAKD
jgi:RsiW-degrading membrane proteinase PrsW (M82 family)